MKHLNTKSIFWVVILAVAVITAAVVLTLSVKKPKHYVWDTADNKSMNADQPYAFNHFDALLERSLPNGYSVRDAHIYPSKKSDEGTFFPAYEAPSAPIDTAFLFIPTEAQFYGSSWDDSKEHMGLLDLDEHARRGGKALYVMRAPYYDAGLIDLARKYSFSSIFNHFNVYDRGHSAYSLENLQNRQDEIVTLHTARGENFKVNNRYVPYRMYDRYIVFQDGKSYQKYDYSPIITPILLDESSRSIYALELYYPETKGKLYILTMGMYFCNLGLTLPEGENLISHFMGLIDDKPVVRLETTAFSSGGASGTGDDSKGKRSILDILLRNDALRFAWLLMVVMMVLILMRGLMRRHPVTKDANDLDRTDFVALREYRFRRSPLLHFLFQCSWLYTKKSDYKALFEVNFRRVARAVKKSLSINFETAGPEDIERIVEHFATGNVSAKEMRSNLQFMLMRHNEQFVTHDEYALSQYIAEQYPFVM